jgi:hypothetical protein
MPHRHVFGRPSESAGARADELAGNAKVAELDYTLPREEDVRGLDVPVDDLLRMQVREALQDLPIRNRSSNRYRYVVVANVTREGERRCVKSHSKRRERNKARTPSANTRATFSPTRPFLLRISSPMVARLRPSQSSMTSLTSVLDGFMYAP